jgi:signal transduction histidine kinase
VSGGNGLRIAYVVLSVVSLAAYLWAFQAQTGLARLPSGFPPAGTGYPATFQGVAAGSREEVRFLAEGFPQGTTVTLIDSGGGTSITALPAAFTRTYLLITLMSGLFFWGVSAFVFAPRAADPAVRDFFWCTFLYGLAVMVGGVYFRFDPGPGALARSGIELACLAVLPVIFVHLTLSFPHRHGFLDRRPWVVPLLWIAAGVAFAWQALAFLGYYRNPGPAAARALPLPQKVADLLLVAEVAAGVLILFFRSRRLVLTRERQQAKWLLWGFTLGVTPYVFLRTLPGLLGLRPPVSAEFDRVFELAIPVAFVFAVVRYRFLDIDIVIRRSLIYGILAAGAAALVLPFVYLARRPVETLAPTWEWLILMGFGIAAGAAFFPLRRLIGRWVDRTVFKISHNYRQRLAAFEPTLADAATPGDLARELKGFLRSTLGAASVDVILAETGPPAGAGEAPPDLAAAADRLIEASAPDRRTWAAPNATSLPEIETPAFPDELSRAGAVVIRVLKRHEARFGWVILGRRANERRYVETDLDALDRTAEAAATALERLRLVRRAAEEASARERLDELNRMKNDFLSRVAHDLRTPLASITWSTENLLDGVTGAPTPAQEEYLRSIRVSGGHLNRLVANLLDIARLESGEPLVFPEPVDAAEAVCEAAAALRMVALEKEVEIRVDAAPGLSRVLADPQKLFEILMNLMDNAVKYTPSGSAVDARVEPDPSGGVRVSVRDRGEGLGPGPPERLFERFRQGEASPQASRKGFGLGLYIVKSYADLMGARVEAGDHPEGGALFTCAFPPAREPGEVTS